MHNRPSRYPGHGCALADGFDATLAYYDTMHAESVARFAELTDARMEEKCITPRGVATPPLYGLTAEEVQARSRV